MNAHDFSPSIQKNIQAPQFLKLKFMETLIYSYGFSIILTKASISFTFSFFSTACVIHKFKKTSDRAPALVTAMGTRLSEIRADHKSRIRV